MSKWQHCTCLSTNWRHSFPACLSLYSQGTQSGRRYRWLISYMTSLSDGSPAHICTHFIFLASILIGLHVATNDIGLSSLKFFWWAPEFLFISASGAFRPFKVIQGRWISCQSKAHMWLPIVRNSNLGPFLHRFGATRRFMCSWPHPYSTLIFGVLPLHQITHAGVVERMGLKLFGREIIFEEFQPVWSRYLIVADGRTDRRKDDMQSHNRALRRIAR